MLRGANQAALTDLELFGSNWGMRQLLMCKYVVQWLAFFCLRDIAKVIW